MQFVKQSLPPGARLAAGYLQAFFYEARDRAEFVEIKPAIRPNGLDRTAPASGITALIGGFGPDPHDKGLAGVGLRLFFGK